MARILLLEDDETLSETIAAVLEADGHTLRRVYDAEEAAEAAYETSYDLYLFDVNVPLMNGFDLLAALRGAGDTTPAFFVTALTDTASLSRGFDAGGDDYIKKPFDIDELLIRVNAALRRKTGELVCGAIRLDPQTMRLRVEGRETDIPRTEKEILRLLLERRDQTVAKEACYEVMETPSDMALRVHISRLKKRLRLAIVNVRGVGYRLECL